MSSTIVNTINTTVVLGSGTYTSPLTITSTGGITAGTGAVALLMTTDGSVTNAGHIAGGAGLAGAYVPGHGDSAAGGNGATGVSMSTGTLSNSGTVIGGTGGIAYFTGPGDGINGAGGTGIVLSGGVVTNNGTIIGGAGATGNLYGGQFNQTNGGNGGYGAIVSGGIFVNTGKVAGGIGGAAQTYGTYGATAGASGMGVLLTGGSFINDGTITSGAIGVRINDGVFIDDGTIISSAAPIVTYNYGGGTPTVLIESGAVLTGKVFAHGTDSTLGVAGNTAFTLAGIGSSFVNFTTLTFASSLSGFAMSGALAGDTVTGFNAGDKLTLTGFAATSDSFAGADELVLKNSSGATETLYLNGFTGTSELLLSSNGTSTTLTSALSRISTQVNTNVTLNNGSYGLSLIVTPTGNVTALQGAAGSNAYAGAYAGEVIRPTNGGAGGVAISSGSGTTLNNQGSATGGSGGSGGNSRFSSTAGANGGNGGIGVSLSSAAITNSGTIKGGAGGSGGYGPVEYGSFKYGAAGGNAGNGGAGLVLTGGTSVNLALLTGGAGGAGGAGGLGLGRYGNFIYYAGGAGGAGGTGLSISGGAFTNSGTILGGAGGLGGLNGHAYGHNHGRAASGSAGNGVYLNGGTLINAGTISGSNAVVFGASAGTLVVERGAVFNGAVAANAAAVDWLEFATGSSLGLGSSFTGFTKAEILSAATVTLSGTLASAVENDGTITTTDGTRLVITGALTGTGTIIDDPSTIVLDGAVSSGQTISVSGTGGVIELGDPAQFNGTIAGFSAGDTLLIDGFTASSSTYTAGHLVLNGNNASSSPETLTIAIAGSFAATAFTFSSDGAGNTDVITCFMHDTPIMTVDGEKAAADLRAGDMVVTANGPLPVRWIGRSPVSTRFADKLRVLPIRITAGALGEGMPRRDLRLSPDHAVFIDGVLIQAGALVNGVTIIRDETVPEQFTYYHVELASHELLLAEGVAVESFVDNVDRMHFHNWAEHEALADAAPIAEMPYPRAKSARQVPRDIGRCIAARAGSSAVKAA